MKAAADVIAEFEKRKRTASERMAVYKSCEDAYYGSSGGAPQTRAMDGSGRPIDRVRFTLQQRGGAPNMFIPIVDDRVAQRGRLPSIKFLPWSDDEEALKTAMKLSRVVQCQWENSNMVVQAPEMAWYLAVKGDAVITLSAVTPGSRWANPLQPPGVYLTTVDPAVCFPAWGSGWQRYVLKDLIIAEVMSGGEAADNWGTNTKGQDQVDVLHYIGTDENLIVVGRETVERIEHRLGFCPAEWIRNKSLAKAGQSDIAHALALHDEFQTMFLVLADALIESTYSQLVVVDPAAMDEHIETGPGAEPIVVKQGGNVFRLQPNNPPSAAAMIMNTAWEQLTRMTESTPIRTTGQLDGSNISNRAIQGVQGPQQERIALQQLILGHHYERINAMIAMMFSTLPDFTTAEMTVFGSERGKDYVETFTGDEFKGWTRNHVRFGSSLGQSSHERSIVALNLHDKQLITGRRVLEELDIEDPDREVQMARQEAQEAMQRQQQQQPGPPPQGATTQDGGPVQPGPGPGVNPGSQNGGGSMPGFAPVSASPDQIAVGGPSPRPDMAQMLRMGERLAQFKARGEILNAKPIPGGVLVVVTDNLDKSIVRDAFHKAGFAKVEIEVGGHRVH